MLSFMSVLLHSVWEELVSEREGGGVGWGLDRKAYWLRAFRRLTEERSQS